MWIFNEVQEMFNDLTSIAKKNGYLISLYGSVLTNGNSDNDLDLIALPYVQCAGYLLNDLCVYFKASLIKTYKSALGHDAFLLQTEEGKVIDLQIRLNQK